MRTILFLLLAAGCGSAPTLSSECTTDDDCELLGTEEVDGYCCSVCGPSAATKASVERFNAWCHEHAGAAGDQCPLISRANRQDRAACEAGRCTVRTSPP